MRSQYALRDKSAHFAKCAKTSMTYIPTRIKEIYIASHQERIRYLIVYT